MQAQDLFRNSSRLLLYSVNNGLEVEVKGQNSDDEDDDDDDDV